LVCVPPDLRSLPVVARLQQLKNVTAQVFVSCQILQRAIDVLGIDNHLFTAVVGCRIRDFLEQTLDDRVQPSRADVLGRFIDREADFGQAGDGVVGELQIEALGGH